MEHRPVSHLTGVECFYLRSFKILVWKADKYFLSPALSPWRGQALPRQVFWNCQSGRDTGWREIWFAQYSNQDTFVRQTREVNGCTLCVSVFARDSCTIRFTLKFQARQKDS